MRLKEIEMDLPYQKNEDFILEIQALEGIEYKEALKRDYETNWKGKRRNFQLMTRCMTSMVERIMKPINTMDCWKIVFECVDNCESTKYKNLLGVYTIQIPFKTKNFFDACEYDKKKMVIDAIVNGTKELSKYINFEVTNIDIACMEIINVGYLNEWMWKKPLKYKDKFVQIKIQHEVSDISIYMVFTDIDKTIFKQVLVINAIPDERIYNQYLGSLEWISEDEAALITKTGDKYIQAYK